MNDVIIVVAVASLVVLAALAPLTRFTRYFIALGDEDDFDELLQAALLRQHAVAFNVLVAAGATAGALLVGAVIWLMFGTGASSLDKAIALLCGIGDTALFGYYVQIWRESGRAVAKVAAAAHRRGPKAKAG